MPDGIRRGGDSRARIAVSAALLMGLGCTGKDPYNPGESLGTFTVATKRLTATCGASQTPPEPWKFDVKLARGSEPASRTVYWIQGGAPVSGILDGSNRTTMSSSDARTVREASTKPPRAACTVRREDKLDATFDTSTGEGGKLDIKSFSGTLAYRFTPEEGSDCLDVVQLGEFAELPCDVAFELSGSPKSP